MKNRVLLAMLIIFIVLSGVWITCGTIFVVRDVEIVDNTVQTAVALTDAEKDDIIAQSGLRGKNILFSLDQEKITADVKSVNRMLKLQSVTAKFPNKVVLAVSRRVPVYCDSENKLYFDAEMCIVNETAADCVNITGAKLALVDGLKTGDLAVGADEQTRCIIDQLKVIATYFDSLNGFKISYDNTDKTVGMDRICLRLDIKSGVTFKIKIKPQDDFLHALEFTHQIYESVGKVNGVYETMYRENNSPNKVGTEVFDANGNILKDKNGKEMLYYEK